MRTYLRLCQLNLKQMMHRMVRKLVISSTTFTKNFYFLNVVYLSVFVNEMIQQQRENR